MNHRSCIISCNHSIMRSHILHTRHTARSSTTLRSAIHMLPKFIHRPAASIARQSSLSACQQALRLTWPAAPARSRLSLTPSLCAEPLRNPPRNRLSPRFPRGAAAPASSARMHHRSTLPPLPPPPPPPPPPPHSSSSWSMPSSPVKAAEKRTIARPIAPIHSSFSFSVSAYM